MQAPWIFSSTFLPYTGEPIDFMLEDRSQPMHGTFANGMFHSRWADYGADRVQSWRGSEGDSSVPVELPEVATAGTFVMLLRRIIKAATGVATSPRHRGRAARSIRTVATASPLLPVVASERGIDSNQISSRAH